jgi:hypothetical protein
MLDAAKGKTWAKEPPQFVYLQQEVHCLIFRHCQAKPLIQFNEEEWSSEVDTTFYRVALYSTWKWISMAKEEVHHQYRCKKCLCWRWNCQKYMKAAQHPDQGCKKWLAHSVGITGYH